MLNRELNIVARSQQLHDGFLMGRAGDVGSVYLQDAVAHTQLAAFRCDAFGDDLSGLDGFFFGDMSKVNVAAFERGLTRYDSND